MLRSLLSGAFRLAGEAGDATKEVRTTDEIAREILTEYDAGSPPAANVVKTEPPAPRPASEKAAPAPAPMNAEEKVVEYRAELEENLRRYDVSARVTAFRERIVFYLLLVFATIAALLAVTAAVLLLSGRGSSAVASAAIALITGIGTVLLRRLRREERAEARRHEADRERAQAQLRTIAFALTLEDPQQRAQEVSAVLAAMRKIAWDSPAAAT